MKRTRFLALLAAFVMVIALQLLPAQAYPVSTWTKIYEGIERADGMATSPRLMRCYALRINLKNPDITTAVSPGNGGAPYETTLQGTNAFLTQIGCKVAVNACHWDVNTPSPYADVLGLTVSGSNVVSPPGGIWPNQLNFSFEKDVWFYRGDTVQPGVWDGIQVGDVVLTNGVPTTWAPAINPYTAFGITQDGKRLIMLVVDGRQSGWSLGCSYAELGQWLKDFGAWNGWHADGGGSTCMVRQDIGVVNRPCYGYVRPVAVSIGMGSTPGNRVGPDVCAMNANRMDVVVRGNLNHVWLKTWTSTGGWAAPVDLGGYCVNDPAICSVEDGRLDVFHCDASTNMIRMKTWTSAGGWTGWSDVGNYFYSAAVCRRDATHIELAARATNNTVYQRTYTTTTNTWSAWRLLGGNTSYTPGIAVQASGCCCVFIRDNATTHLLLKYGGPDTWYGWADLGGGLDGPPTAVCRTENYLDVFGRGNDFCLKHINMTTQGVWGAWESFAGTSVGKIAVCARTATTINTFHRGLSDELWMNSWAVGGSWSAWAYQGNCFY